MDLLWSASTTMRNPERTYSFLKTINEIEGRIWNDETQKVLQSLLIKNRFYTPTKKNLSQDQIDILSDLNYEMTYEEARDIFDSKKYVDAAMRGRTSFDPIEKLGLVSLEYDASVKQQRVHTTVLGQKFLSGEIALESVVFSNLLKFQYPNPLSDDRRDYNTKPFINTLKLIKAVDTLCQQRGMKIKGVSKDEFGIFVLSIKSFDEVQQKAEDLLSYRQQIEAITDIVEKEAFRTNYVQNYLPTFVDPVNNTKEYADNIIKYLRLTKYIYIRGGGYYVDLEPRRMVEIDALLEFDTGAARNFTLEEYKKYIADYESYVLPFETPEKLTTIARDIIHEINVLQVELGQPTNEYAIETGVTGLKQQIEELRTFRMTLQNLKLKDEYQQIEQIDTAISALSNITHLGMKPSVALEKWANIALNIINDARLIKPNAPMGDDNEPTFTAPANVPDIECFYEGFGAICEVTMLTGRNQWYNEGQPVMRHLRDFEVANDQVPNYCLFIAPTIHIDTINTFWTAVKYEYQGQKQRIIPLTIAQLIDILQGIKNAKTKGKRVTQDSMQKLYSLCIDIAELADSTQWNKYISQQISAWKERVIA